MQGGLFAAKRDDSRDKEDPNQDILDASYNELQQLSEVHVLRMMKKVY